MRSKHGMQIAGGQDQIKGKVIRIGHMGYLDRFDALTHLINWVELGKAPDMIVAARMEEGVPKMTRPLCPYPETARYKGLGNPNDAASFECADP